MKTYSTFITKFFVLILSLAFFSSLNASNTQGSSETITVETPGTLASLLTELESLQVGELTLKGRINASDIQVIKSRSGRFKNLEVINLKEAVIVEGGGAYASRYEGSDIGMGGTTYNYYYADTCYQNETSEQTGLGGANTTINVYGNHLDALFFICPNLKSIVLPDMATCIGDYMFCGCDNLLSVEYPDKITSIGNNAFNNCDSLQQLILPATLTQIGEKAFYNCRSLVSVGSLEHVNKLGTQAFYGCTNLVGDTTNMTMDLSGLDTIPASAFFDCRKLENIRFSTSLKLIGDKAFELNYSYDDEYGQLDSIILPEGLVSIGAHAFADQEKLSKVNIPGSLKRLDESSFAGTPYQENLTPDGGIYYIGNIAIASEDNLSALTFREGTVAVADNFNGCKAATSVSFPNTVEYVGKHAFYEFNITELVLPEGVKEIAEQAFYSCDKLKQCELPSTLRIIKDLAFSFCTSLTTVTITENVELIGVYAFSCCSSLVRVSYNAINAKVDDCCNTLNGAGEYYYRVFSDCPGMDKVIVGSKVQTLPSGLFKDCTGLLKIEFQEREDGVPLTVGNSVFYGCSSLTTCPLPNGTLSVGHYAFFNCTSLPSDNLFPVGLREIGAYAFMNCTKLSKVVLPEGLHTLQDYAFENCPGITEMVLPESLVYLGDNLFGNQRGSNNISNLNTLTINSTDLDLDYHLSPCTVEKPYYSYLVLGYGAFYNVKTLKTVNIGPRVKRLKGEMFIGCDSLESVNFAEVGNLEYIGYETFGSLDPYNYSSYYNESPSPWILTKMYCDEPVYIGKVLYLYNSRTNGQNTKNTTAVIREGTVALGGESLQFFMGDSIALPASVKYVGSLGIKSGLHIYSAAVVPPVVMLDEDDLNKETIAQCKLFVPQSSMYDYDAVPVWRLFWIYPHTGSNMNGIDKLLIDDNLTDKWYDLNGCSYDSRPEAPGMYIHRGEKLRIR